VLQIMSDGSVQLRLLPALDASVTEYFVVVVPDQLTQNKRPQDFTLDEVCLLPTASFDLLYFTLFE